MYVCNICCIQRKWHLEFLLMPFRFSIVKLHIIAMHCLFRYCLTLACIHLFAELNLDVFLRSNWSELDRLQFPEGLEFFRLLRVSFSSIGLGCVSAKSLRLQHIWQLSWWIGGLQPASTSTNTIPGLWGLPQYNTDIAPNKLALLSGERKKERKKRMVLVLRPFSDLPLAYPCLHNLLL